MGATTRDRRLVRPVSARRRGRVPIGALALLVLLPLTLAACTSPSLPLLRKHTVVLIPSDLSTHYRLDFYNTRGYCSFGTDNSGDPLPNGRVQVGVDNSYDPGSGPLPCVHKFDVAYRAGIRFELSQFQRMTRKVVEKAVLNWRIESAVVRDRYGNRNGVASGRDATDCVGAVLESSKSIYTEGEFLPGLPYRDGRGDVTGLVTSWIVNGDPNRGFVLVGLDESYPRNNAACVNVITDIQLTLTYLAP